MSTPDRVRRLWTCGRGTAERYDGDPDVHVISIRTPGNPPAELQPGWGYVTRVKMDDGPREPKGWDLRAMVDAVIRANAANADILVHCEMGVSRSVGVAHAISAACGIPFTHAHAGNATVRAALLRALMQALSPATERTES